MEKGFCKKCGKEILWIKTRRGKLMPVDPKLITVITEKGETIKGYIPHWSTCLYADYFRKSQKQGKEKQEAFESSNARLLN